MINPDHTIGAVGGSNPTTSQPVQPQPQEAQEGACYGRTVTTADCRVPPLTETQSVICEGPLGSVGFSPDGKTALYGNFGHVSFLSDNKVRTFIQNTDGQWVERDTSAKK
ncbi:hypothetical protein [Endozoicomonas sp. 8E]|uniref:hypothetical protein n=1 Tax=Endozoicomonas sp. 8E TaxID=3035692 RepID=UPI002938F135|nr:hypothetical protein [Endozoicomonas sp. 8E]WOG26614.1 hypothetical protein P6910_18990 [Endozoicomonas sp. 8E]